eukprot:scaffold9079_cov127-Isochrysis_galbana.AAC.1
MDEWERGGGVTGRYWTEVSRRVAASEAPEERDDPDFVFDTNNLITFKQKGPRFGFEHHNKSETLNTLAQAVVVHAALTPSPAHSGLNKENGMGKEWGRGEGECPDGRRAEEPSHVAASE